MWHRLDADERLCPEFVEKPHLALQRAVSYGLRPEVHEAYRSPEESDKKHAKWKKKKGGRAAPAWHSVHSYGLAMDVWLFDRKKHYISNKTKGWYPLYKLLRKRVPHFCGANLLMTPTILSTTPIGPNQRKANC